MGGLRGGAYSEPVTWILIIENNLNMTKKGMPQQSQMQ